MKLNPKLVYKAFKEAPVDYWGYFLRMYISHRWPQVMKFYLKMLNRRWDKVKPADDLSRLNHCYVTAIPNTRAGIGHTLSEYITGRIWAHKAGVTYAHCQLVEPWESIMHFQGDAPTLRELKKRGIKTFKMPRHPSDPEKLDYKEITAKWASLAKEGPVCFVLGDGQNAYDIAYPSRELRQLYRSHPDFEKRLDVRVKDKINVSVHVRRRNQADMLNPSVHDVNSPAYRARYLEGDYFLSLCRIIEEVLGADEVQFNLFSQGDPEAFSDFKVLKNLRLCLETDQYETFHNLTLSDILIVSPSSFSFKAGMLCPGLKFAKYPWWHEVPEDDEWIRVGEDPLAEKARLSQRLRTFVKHHAAKSTFLNK